MNKNILLYLIHIPVWIIALFVAYFFSSDDVPEHNSNYVIYSTIAFSVWILASFYTFYSFLVPKFLEKSNYRSFWIYTILFVLIIMPGFFLFLIQITHVAAISFFESISVEGYKPWVGSVMGTIFCGGLGSLYRFSIDWFRNLHNKKDIENIKLQGELNAIKSKLNPHLLFNTLNNIDALIQTNPDRASVALSKLSNLLRYVIYETENEQISIQRETEFLFQYIEIEKMRLSNPESITFTTSGLNDILVPPLIFLPFIENGFKHSNLDGQNQKLNISISASNNEILFKCINTLTGKSEVIGQNGIGLKLVKKRLELLFPQRHTLDIKINNNEFCVTLIILL